MTSDQESSSTEAPQAQGAGTNDSGGNGQINGEGNGSSSSDTRERVAKAGRDAARGAKRKAESLYQDASSTAAAAASKASETIDDAAEKLASSGHESLGQAAGALSDRLQGFASYIDGRKVEDLLADARELAKRNPGLFIAGGVALGFVISRFFKASTSQSRNA